MGQLIGGEKCLSAAEQLAVAPTYGSSSALRRLVLCMPGGSFNKDVVLCLLSTIAYFRSMDWKLTLRMLYKSNVWSVRNDIFGAPNTTCLKAGLKPQVFEGNIPDYNYMMWIDSDMIWKPTDIERLMSWDKDIICGLAKMRDGETIATVEHWDTGRLLNKGSFEYLSDESVRDRNEPFPVAFTGMAFMLIKRGVLETFDYPWIEPYIYDLGETKCMAGEDVSFCKKAQRLGFEVLVDPTVRIGHMKEVVLT